MIAQTQSKFVGAVMAKLWSRVKRFACDDSGSTAIEYSLIAVIVSISIVFSLTNVKTTLTATFTKVGTELKSNTSN